MASDVYDGFDHGGFWGKLRRTVAKIPFAKDAVAAYFAMVDDATPLWAKATLAGALVYFISPVDLIPDAIPVLGYTDDAAVLATALASVGAHVTDEHRRKAAAFFGC